MIPLFYTICNGRDHGHSITHSQDLDVLMYSSKLHVRSCAGSFCVSTVHSIVLQHFNVLHYVSQLPSNSTTLVFFTTDHFILFVHSSRMFYYFVYSHVHVVGSCPAMLAAGRLPVCLLACCQWGYRVIPSYYSAPSYEPLSLSSCVWRVLMLQPLLADS